MKRLLSLITVLVLVFFGVRISQASPLVFKAVKTIQANDFADLTTIETGKYKQIRIAVKVKPDSVSQRVNIYAVEDNQEIFLFSAMDKDLSFSTVIDVPPSKIKLSARGNGIYSIYVWGS